MESFDVRLIFSKNAQALTTVIAETRTRAAQEARKKYSHKNILEVMIVDNPSFATSESIIANYISSKKVNCVSANNCYPSDEI